jgi:hypothetical protein
MLGPDFQAVAFPVADLSSAPGLRPGTSTAGYSRLRRAQCRAHRRRDRRGRAVPVQDASPGSPEPPPIPVWSGNTVRIRLNRGGNLAVNCALHMIAVTQACGIGLGRDYLDKQLAPAGPAPRPCASCAADCPTQRSAPCAPRSSASTSPIFPTPLDMRASRRPGESYPFIEAEKAQRRNVKRACELLKVSCASYNAARQGRPSSCRSSIGSTRLLSNDRYNARIIRLVCYVALQRRDDITPGTLGSS